MCAGVELGSCVVFLLGWDEVGEVLTLRHFYSDGGISRVRRLRSLDFSYVIEQQCYSGQEGLRTN